jgi:hypothetical protein
MKVAKIKTNSKKKRLLPELIVGKLYEVVPREDTLAPYINPYVWFGSQFSSKDEKYYQIKSNKGTKNYFYPISEFESIEEFREKQIEKILD